MKFDDMIDVIDYSINEDQSAYITLPTLNAIRDALQSIKDGDPSMALAKVIHRLKVELLDKNKLIATFRGMLETDNLKMKEDGEKIKELRDQLAWMNKMNASMVECIMADGK